MIVDISGAVGDASKSVPIATSSRIKLKYFHLPPLPLLDMFVDGVTADGEPQNVAAVSSIDGLCDFFAGTTTRNSKSARVVWKSHCRRRSPGCLKCQQLS